MKGRLATRGSLQKEALDFGNELQASFALTCRAIAALIARDGAAPLAEGEPPPRSRAYWRVAFTDAARSVRSSRTPTRTVIPRKRIIEPVAEVVTIPKTAARVRKAAFAASADDCEHNGSRRRIASS